MEHDPADFSQTLRVRLARFAYLASMQLFDQGERSPDVESLAERMQPRLLSEVLGPLQLHSLEPLVDLARREGELPPLLLYGPPGSGKRALARLLAQQCALPLERVSAATRDERDLIQRIERAASHRQLEGRPALIFLERPERCSKPQVDALLAQLDTRALCVIGATTENPWVSVPSALMARMRVLELSALGEEAMVRLLRRALRDPERGLGRLALDAPVESLVHVARHARGDARRALDLLERAVRITTERGLCEISPERIADAIGSAPPYSEHGGEGQAGLERAFVWAIRSSDPDAALYWMMRVLRAGEAPTHVMRRMILFASEDIGIADPSALELTMTADRVLQRLGMPEALRAMGQCCVYLATAPKSAASYQALQLAERDVREHGALPAPASMDERASLLPEPLGDRRYYVPTDRGFEARMRPRLDPPKR